MYHIFVTLCIYLFGVLLILFVKRFETLCIMRLTNVIYYYYYYLLLLVVRTYTIKHAILGKKRVQTQFLPYLESKLESVSIYGKVLTYLKMCMKCSNVCRKGKLILFQHGIW